jgi:CBS domain containing-hemolysin-like protein
VLLSVTYIIIVFLLVFANGFFVASEFSLVMVRRSRIVTLANTGNRRATILLELIDNLNVYISATQLGITMASLALGWIGEPAFAQLLQAPLHGHVSDAVRHTISFTIAFTAITFLHIVLGELAPKTLALERAEKVALAIAWPMRVFHKLFSWPIWLLDRAGIYTVRLCGLHASVVHSSVYTVEELRHLIDASHKSGTLEADEQKLLHSVFEFSDAEVCEVMVPRNAVAALPVTASLDEVKKTFRTTGYSRIPVYREHLDNVVGVLYRRDLEPYLEQPQTEGFDLAKLAHPPKYIPAKAQLSTALKQMQASRTHLAFAVDEYGGTEGIITLEDLLEEIVGEIEDEYDEEASLQITEDNGSYLLDGMLTVRDANHHLSLHLPEEASYTTIAGFLLARAGSMINVGETIVYEGAQFTVVSLDRRRIRRIRYIPALTDDLE